MGWDDLNDILATLGYFFWTLFCFAAMINGWANAENFEDFFLATMFTPMIWLLGVGIAQRGI